MAEAPFPDGRNVAVVTSWEGGRTTDRILHRMLDQYGYGATFYLVPQNIGADGFLNQDDIAALLASNNDIGLHAASIPEFDALSPNELTVQLKAAKTQLETITGSPVVSFCYFHSEEGQKAGIPEAIEAAGFTSARTKTAVGGMTTAVLRETGLYRMPVSAFFREDFGTIQMGWMDIEETTGGIYHFWGRTEELGENPNDWVDFECILGFMGGISNVWYGSVADLVSNLK